MPYDLYLFTKLFAVRDKWNANVPYVANVKINNAAKGTETYADSVIHVITEETHRFMKKKKSKTHVVLNNCSQGGGGKIFGSMHKIQGWIFSVINYSTKK